MTFVALALLAVAALLPLAFTLLWQTAARSRRDSAVAIHRQQLQELDRDLADGRIAANEHATALLEVQRRLLAAAGTTEPEVQRASRTPLLVALVVVPLLAAGLYAVDGHPFMPAAPLAARVAEADKTARESAHLIETLRAKLATMDPHDEMTRQGYVLLGNAENSMGHLAEAAEAWRHAVAIRFDPELAALTAEAQTRLDGKVSPDSADLFRRALAAGPGEAAWRPVAMQRLDEAAKQ